MSISTHLLCFHPMNLQAALQPWLANSKKHLDFSSHILLTTNSVLLFANSSLPPEERDHWKHPTPFGYCNFSTSWNSWASRGIPLPVDEPCLKQVKPCSANVWHCWKDSQYSRCMLKARSGVTEPQQNSMEIISSHPWTEKGMVSPCTCSFQLLFSWRYGVETWKITFSTEMNKSNVTFLIQCHQKFVWAKEVC